MNSLHTSQLISSSFTTRPYEPFCVIRVVDERRYLSISFFFPLYPVLALVVSFPLARVVDTTFLLVVFDIKPLVAILALRIHRPSDLHFSLSLPTRFGWSWSCWFLLNDVGIGFMFCRLATFVVPTLLTTSPHKTICKFGIIFIVTRMTPMLLEVIPYRGIVINFFFPWIRLGNPPFRRIMDKPGCHMQSPFSFSVISNSSPQWSHFANLEVVSSSSITMGRLFFSSFSSSSPFSISLSSESESAWYLTISFPGTSKLFSSSFLNSSLDSQ